MSHTGNSTTAQLQLLCNHTQIMEHHYYYSNYGTQLFVSKYGIPTYSNHGTHTYSNHGTLTYANHGTLYIITQIMEHFKNHGTYSQSNIHPYLY